MSTQPPLFILDSLVRQVIPHIPPPPDWLVREMQNRLVLVVNHILQSEPEAMNRLARQKGRTLRFQWPWAGATLALNLSATPAGLLNLEGPLDRADLTVVVDEPSVLSMGQALLGGEKPRVRIDGDVQLAAEVNWLVDNLRWDIENDLARLVGDEPAHVMGTLLRHVVEKVKGFAAGQGAGSGGPGA